MHKNTVVYINWDGFGKYYLDFAIKNSYQINTLKEVIKKGVSFNNAYTSIPSITNAMQPTIVSGTTPKYTDNHFRYFNKHKRKVIQEIPRRINRAETIAESLSRQGLKIISINQFALEDRGTFKDDRNHPYISVPGKNGLARFDYAINFVKTLNASGHQFNKMPRLIAIYLDELDDLGHNDSVVHGIPVAKTEEGRIQSVALGLEMLDKKLGEFVKTIKEIDEYDNFTFILTSDHGMTTSGRQEDKGRNYPSSLDDLIDTIELLELKVEFLKEHQYQKKENTDVIVVTVGLQAQISYPKLIDRRQIKKRNNIIINAIEDKEYFGDYKALDELEKLGIKRGFTDLLVSPKIPHNFKPGKFTKFIKAKGQHDSLDKSSQKVPLIMWGNKVKQNIKVNEKVYVTSVAPTISALLNKNIPLDATAEALYPQLLIEKSKLSSTINSFHGSLTVDALTHRFDIKYRSNKDNVLNLLINGDFIRAVFFPHTYKEPEIKTINISLQEKDRLILKKENYQALGIEFINVEVYFEESTV